ncbi:MAG: DUF4277 domain-containing protein [Woronichinia naegeliana WA131]|uniref:DUF4277 domain-containing protein n=1 Tax=Woronichinia naegeliana WA131 TaxID=2824559 RepID=A0A977KV32_9CYAN|nr:MAG: DUF4277 domain-containing protein [Woronichinia naegeliana WA131]
MENLNIKDLDHLGLVAGIIDEMGLVEIINEEVGTHPQKKLSVGTIVKAMILNCLGCVTGQCEVLGKSTSLLGFQPPTPFKPLQDL